MDDSDSDCNSCHNTFFEYIDMLGHSQVSVQNVAMPFAVFSYGKEADM